MNRLLALRDFSLKNLLASTALAGAFALATGFAAMAGPIAPGSELSLDGDNTFTTTSITFTSAASVGGESGSFAELINCTGCGTLTSFNNTSSDFLLYTATEGAVTTTLTTTGLPTFDFTPAPPPPANPLESLSIMGTGELTLTGFDPTPGFYSITTQGPAGAETVTFSATSVATAVPEPAALGILGIGLVLMGLFGLRRRGVPGRPSTLFLKKRTQWV